MKKTKDELKELVKEKYATIVTSQSALFDAESCCGTNDCCQVDYSQFSEDYSALQGYMQDADLGLGCGLPTEFAQIHSGDTVLDLGSGAGNDCFIARELAGPTGKIIGVDMTPEMIRKARSHTDRLGFNNVEFRLGDIEDLPVGTETIDVVISNCVLNLVPEKVKAFKEMFRVVKQGGHFSVSDVVIRGNMPESIRDQAILYAGCISGAIQKEEYLAMISDAGFSGIEVQKSKPINLPDDLLSQFLTEQEWVDYRNGAFSLESITVYGEKPGFQLSF